MTDLTEQWKKGELPYAEYYIKLAGGEYTNDVWDFDGWQSFNKEGDVVVEVLAPVPSYEEWQAKLEENAKLKEEVENCEFIIKSRESEIVKLKELLKWCRDELFEVYSNEIPRHEDAPIIKKLDEVLK